MDQEEGFVEVVVVIVEDEVVFVGAGEEEVEVRPTSQTLVIITLYK